MYRFRNATTEDIESMFAVRASTRQNPISAERLAGLGITPSSVAAALAAGDIGSWVCEYAGAVVGFCNADMHSGEVLVLAVLPEHEGKGIGKRLLSLAIECLQRHGYTRLWLFADSDPGARSHGFYRANGWAATGWLQPNGDEELVYVDMALAGE